MNFRSMQTSQTKKPTVVEADSSSYGLGGCLLQEYEEGLRPVAFCSRSLSNTEQRYAQIEKECLDSVWACERFDRYLMGLDSFTLYSDRKPLIPLINSQDLSETPLRCQRMLIRLLRYKPVAIHQPGKMMVTSDTLSRSPAACSQETSNLHVDVRFHVSMVTSSWPVSDGKLKQLKEETQQNVSLRTAINYTVMGWPTYKQDVMLAARDLFDFRNELSLYDGLLLRGDKIVIPYSMREEILDHIHDGHLGITKCRERANQGVWWPGLSKQIQDCVAMCKLCMRKKPAQQSEPLLPSTLPNRPFQRIGVDLCELKGKHFLVSVDYFSRYIDILHLQSLTSGAIINKMKPIFSQNGIAETVLSDNGPQFAAKEFQQFAEEWNFHQATSSPHYPQANGEAERAVRSAKEFLRQNDPHLALLTYRATPLPALGVSPAELAYGRRLRTTLPAVPQTLSPRPVNHNLIRNRDMANKTLQKKYFDRKTCHLPDLEPDDQVLLKKGEGEKGWNQPGEVVGQCAPRSYTISTPDGQLRRNRKNLMLQKTPHKNHPEGGLQTAPVPQEPAPPIPWPVQSPRQIPVIRPASPVEPSHQPEPSSSSPVSAKMPAENQLNHIVPDLVGLSLSLSDISDCVNLLVVKTWGRLPMQRLGCVFLSSRIESSQEMCNSYARG